MALPLRDFLLALIAEIENASDPGRGDSKAIRSQSELPFLAQ